MLACRSGSTAGPPASSASRPTRPAITLLVVAGLSLLFRATAGPGAAQNPPPDATTEYGTVVRPLVQKYCMTCHSTKLKKGSLDLERLASPAGPRKDLKVWQQVIEMLDAGDMPPKAKPQPAAEERKALITWVRGFLDAEARARAGDPGHVPLRRLSNAEYDYTIRDLTGVDLRPTREFPADGAAGEGFTNAAEALSEISPAPVCQVPQRGQGRLGTRRATAGRLPLLADQNATRLDRRESGPTPPVLRGVHCRWQTTAAALSHGHRPTPRRSGRRQHDSGRCRSQGKAQRQVPRGAVADADGQGELLPTQLHPRPLAAGVGEGRARARRRDSRVAGRVVEIRPGRKLPIREHGSAACQ